MQTRRAQVAVRLPSLRRVLEGVRGELEDAAAAAAAPPAGAALLLPVLLARLAAARAARLGAAGALPGVAPPQTPGPTCREGTRGVVVRVCVHDVLHAFEEKSHHSIRSTHSCSSTFAQHFNVFRKLIQHGDSLFVSSMAPCRAIFIQFHHILITHCPPRRT